MSLKNLGIFKALKNIRNVDSLLFFTLIKYFFNISMVRFSKICFELPLIVLLLNLGGGAEYIAYISVCYRIVSIFQKVIQMPLDRLLPTLFSKGEYSDSSILFFSFKYYRLTTSLLGFIFVLFSSFIIESLYKFCLLYTSPSPRDRQKSRMPSSA